MTIPPPRPSRGLSMYLYPGGVALLRWMYSSGFCQVSVMVKKSMLLSVINSLSIGPFLFSERVLSRANLRVGWYWVGGGALGNGCR